MSPADADEQPDREGAEKESLKDKLPRIPAPFRPDDDDDSPLGDTDQHSDA